MPVKSVIIDKANRMYQMAPDIMAFVQPEKRRRLLKRAELLDLASFAWPLLSDEEPKPTTLSIRQANPESINQLRLEIADWLTSTHKTRPLSDSNVFIGESITRLVHRLSMLYVDYGDIAFVPNLAIPLYRQAITANGGEAVTYDISAKNGWRPSFDRVQTRLGRMARLLFLNSPHNPTGVCLGEKEMAELVSLANRENILIINDAAYFGIPEQEPTSLLSVPGGRKVGVEIYSIPYLFGLSSAPLAFVAGNREVIRGLKATCRILPQFLSDYAVSSASQMLPKFPSDSLLARRKSFRKIAGEADRLLEKLSLEKSGFDNVPFVWARIWKRSNSVIAARLLLRRHRILVAPGTGFGENGQGYLRLSLTARQQDYIDATARVGKKTKLLATERSDR